MITVILTCVTHDEAMKLSTKVDKILAEWQCRDIVYITLREPIIQSDTVIKAHIRAKTITVIGLEDGNFDSLHSQKSIVKRLITNATGLKTSVG